MKPSLISPNILLVPSKWRNPQTYVSAVWMDTAYGYGKTHPSPKIAGKNTALSDVPPF